MLCPLTEKVLPEFGNNSHIEIVCFLAEGLQRRVVQRLGCRQHGCHLMPVGGQQKMTLQGVTSVT